MQIYVVSDNGFEVGQFISYEGDTIEYKDPDTGALCVQSVEDVFFNRPDAHEEYSANFDHINEPNGARQ